MVGRNYTVRNAVTGNVLFSDRRCIAVIGQGSVLSDKDILNYYFNGDKEKMEESRELERLRRQHRTSKMVFKNAVVPITAAYHFQEV